MIAQKNDYNCLSAYGVVLNRLTEDKLEIVRHWRNHPKISQYMEYRGNITSEEQQKWFKKIDNDYNYYYLINVDDKDIGLINVRDIDYVTKIGEPGIFIWEDDYLNSDYSFRAILCLEDFCFETLNLVELNCHILKDNKRAIQFNKLLGFKLLPHQEDNYNQQYTLNKDDYFINRRKIIKYL